MIDYDDEDEELDEAEALTETMDTLNFGDLGDLNRDYLRALVLRAYALERVLLAGELMDYGDYSDLCQLIATATRIDDVDDILIAHGLTEENDK